MSQNQALHTLLDHAERERDQARATVLQAEDTGRRFDQQKQQLLGYRTEYEQRHPSVDGRSTTIDVLRHHAHFMERLDQALQHLQGQVRLHDTQMARLRQQLLAREMRLASVRKLLERRGKEQLRKDERQDQRATDDAAQQQRRSFQDSTQGSPWH